MPCGSFVRVYVKQELLPARPRVNLLALGRLCFLNSTKQMQDLSANRRLAAFAGSNHDDLYLVGWLLQILGQFDLLVVVSLDLGRRQRLPALGFDLSQFLLLDLLPRRLLF